MYDPLHKFCLLIDSLIRETIQDVRLFEPGLWASKDEKVRKSVEGHVFFYSRYAEEKNDVRFNVYSVVDAEAEHTDGRFRLYTMPK